MGCENGSSDSSTSNISTPSSYTITFDANGGSGTMKEITVRNSETLPSSEFTPPTGKVFGGWNTKANGRGTQYDAGETVYIYSDTTLYAQWVDPVATVKVAETTTEYGTVMDAVKAANEANGSTITLKRNSATSALTIGGNNITLDLNGCTLETNSTDSAYSFTSLLTVSSSASLTIKDSGTNGGIYYKIKQESSYTTSQTICNYGSLTVEGGTIKNTGGTSSSYAIATPSSSSSDAKLTISGGTISSDSSYAIYDGSSYGSTITISGGTITSKAKDAVSLSKGSITVTQGTISSTDGSAIKGGTSNISGGSISSDNTYAIANSNITLSGNPQITGKNADIQLTFPSTYNDANHKIAKDLTMSTALKITDGQSSTSWLSDGKTIFSSDNNYTIKQGDVDKLKLVDSKGNDYKYKTSYSPYTTYTYTFQLDSSKNAVTLKETTS